MGNISLAEKKVIDVEIEKSRLEREKALLILDKSLFLYLAFLFIAVIGFINNYMTAYYLNILIILGVIILIIGSIPFLSIMKKEEKRLNNIIKDLRKKGDKR